MKEIVITWSIVVQPKTHCAQVPIISAPPPPPKKRPFWKGMLFQLFFHEFLRWGHKSLRGHSKTLNGPSGWILADTVPFQTANRILNFIVLQKFLQFWLCFDTFCFKRRKCSQIVSKIQNFVFFKFSEPQTYSFMFLHLFLTI